MKLLRITFSVHNSFNLPKDTKEVLENYFKNIEECFFSNIKNLQTKKSKALSFFFVPYNYDRHDRENVFERGMYIWTHIVKSDIHEFIQWSEKEKRMFLCNLLKGALNSDIEVVSVIPPVLNQELSVLEEFFFTRRTYPNSVSKEITELKITKSFEYGGKNIHSINFCYLNKVYDIEYSFIHFFDAGPRSIFVKEDYLKVLFYAHEISVNLKTKEFNEMELEGISKLDNISMY